MILCWRRHGKAGGCRIPLKTIRWMRFEIERTHRNGWTICDEDVLTYTSREVLFHITGFYQWFMSSSLSRLWMTDKLQSSDCTLQFGNKVSSLTCRHVMKTKYYESLWKQAFNAFETFCFRNVPWKLHIENLIQSSNREVWNKYQDIRGVTRKCNQTNQKQAIINCKHHKPKMQRYASEKWKAPVWSPSGYLEKLSSFPR